MQWINVSAQLPPYETGSEYGSIDTMLWDGEFMHYGYYHYALCAWMCFTRGAREPYFIYQGVTHWQPLPTPPTKD